MNPRECTVTKLPDTIIVTDNNTEGYIRNAKNGVLIVRRGNNMFHTDEHGNKLYEQEYGHVAQFTVCEDDSKSRAVVMQNIMMKDNPDRIARSRYFLIDKEGKRSSKVYRRLRKESETLLRAIPNKYLPWNWDKSICITYDDLELQKSEFHHDLGSRTSTLTVYETIPFTDYYFGTGCFMGSLEEFEKAVRETHFDFDINEFNRHGREYMEIIESYKVKRGALYGK